MRSSWLRDHAMRVVWCLVTGIERRIAASGGVTESGVTESGVTEISSPAVVRMGIPCALS
jgi:hypothetical protein